MAKRGKYNRPTPNKYDPENQPEFDFSKWVDETARPVEEEERRKAERESQRHAAKHRADEEEKGRLADVLSDVPAGAATPDWALPASMPDWRQHQSAQPPGAPPPPPARGGPPPLPAVMPNWAVPGVPTASVPSMPNWAKPTTPLAPGAPGQADAGNAAMPRSVPDWAAPPPPPSPTGGGAGSGIPLDKLLGAMGAGKGAAGAAAGMGGAAGGVMEAAAGGPVGVVIAAAAEAGERSKKMRQDIMDTAVSVAQEAAKGLTGSRAGEAIGGVFGAGEKGVEGAQKVMEDVGGPLGKALGQGLEPLKQMFAFPRMLAESVDKLRDFNKAVFASNARFGEFSGAMAKVVADQEVWEIRNQQLRGDRRAATAETQSMAAQNLEHQIGPLDDLFANATNRFSEFLSHLAAGSVMVANEALGLDPDGKDPEAAARQEQLAQAKLLLYSNPAGWGYMAAGGSPERWVEQYGSPPAAQGPRRVD